MNFINFIRRLFARENRNHILGRNAENFAVKYIKKHTKYKILLKNFRHKNYETDILAYDKEANCLVIVEVKARNINALVGGYHSALKPSKIHSIIECKNAYMKLSPHKFDSFSYNIFEISHDDKGVIVEYFFHENIAIKRKRSKGSTLF